MAELEFVLQAVSPQAHATVVNQVLELERPSEVLISVGFIRSEGIEALEDNLRAHRSVCTCFIGIRNDITSIQAVKRLLSLGVRVIAVDTSSRQVIFHPKVYLACNVAVARVVIGSANLTFSGLHNNIEASSYLRLDLTNGHERRFVDQIRQSFAGLQRDYPLHVFPIADVAHAETLLAEGRLSDERLVAAPTAGRAARAQVRDGLPRMPLHQVHRVHPRKAPARPQAQPAIGPMPAPSPMLLVWESKGLVERDLTIPTGETTNPTGSMYLKKGNMAEIDQRHYFRDEVFDSLAWTRDPKKPHLERAVAVCELVVKNVNYGTFDLRLTHNTDRQSRTYQQGNSMTSLHWGVARKYVAKRDLLDRTLLLYRTYGALPTYRIEID